MAKIELNKSFLDALNTNLNTSLKELQNILNEEKVIPFQTGTLQESAEVERKSDNTYSLVYDVDYAETVYYHPEYVIDFNGKKREYFHKTYGKNAYHNAKYHKDWNENAQPRWLDKYIQNPNLFANIYIDCLRKTNWIM